jgi:hypothetical protein
MKVVMSWTKFSNIPGVMNLGTLKNEPFDAQLSNPTPERFPAIFSKWHKLKEGLGKTMDTCMLVYAIKVHGLVA